MKDYSSVIEKLPGVRRQRKPGYWLARCPAHDDTRPSLTCWIGGRGQLNFRCWSQGCSAFAIVKAIGVKMSDLFDQQNNFGTSKRDREIVATYDYRDETGSLLYQVVRFKPKGFAQRRPDGKDRWIWNLDGIRKVLYRLPDLMISLAQNPARMVFVVEGEKDADALSWLDMVATCNPCGACHWHHDYSRVLRNANVVILPDNDDPGRDHAASVAGSLMVYGAASIRIVHLPGMAVNGDVSDWLDAWPRETPLTPVAVKEALWVWVREAPVWRRSDGGKAA